jgi:hypothetical protein
VLRDYYSFLPEGEEKNGKTPRACWAERVAIRFAILFGLDVGRLAKSKFDGRLGKLN